ncbi:MAG: hypothetical protein AAF368_17355, partial [Planctomycetota bacterium]
TAVATLSLPEGGTSDWRLEVERLGSISGSLIGVLEGPEQLTISWSCAGQPAADGVVRDDQTFLIAGAQPGDCWLIVERGQETMATRTLSLAPGEPKEGVELVVEAPPRLSGRLTLPGRDDHQVGGAEIWLTDRRGAVLAATRADWTGAFELSAPVDGEHVLRARLSGSDGVFETAVALPFEDGEFLWPLAAGRASLRLALGVSLASRPMAAYATPVGQLNTFRATGNCVEESCWFDLLPAGQYTFIVIGSARQVGLDLAVTASEISSGLIQF